MTWRARAKAVGEKIDRSVFGAGTRHDGGSPVVAFYRREGTPPSLPRKRFAEKLRQTFPWRRDSNPDRDRPQTHGRSVPGLAVLVRRISVFTAAEFLKGMRGAKRPEWSQLLMWRANVDDVALPGGAGEADGLAFRFGVEGTLASLPRRWI